jgi:hypothetical protein
MVLAIAMGGIYLIRDEGQLVEMSEMAYDSEDLLQGLLARYPSLLAGDQIDSTAPRRWLLISREVPIASEEGGAWRWSVDHIFIDQDAVPTLVEVKRSADTRTRREVVGQMLDYAANVVVYWPVEQMQARFEQRCSDEGREPFEVLAESLGHDVDFDQFWQQAKTNLQAGRIRMVFVADRIPTELQRIVEFLNAQMDPAAVLAVEVRQYVGQGHRAMVPRVLGQTAAAQQKKFSTIQPARQWDEETFFHALEDTSGPDVAAAGRRILQWARSRGFALRWGKGRKHGGVYPELGRGGQPCRPVGILTNGRVEINFGGAAGMRSWPPFDREEKRREFWTRLEEIDGVKLSTNNLAGWPEFSLAALTGDAAMERFLGTLDWFVQEVTAS